MDAANAGMNTCEVCGARLEGDGTKEHVIPTWLRRKLGWMKRVVTGEHHSSRGDVISRRRLSLNKFWLSGVCNTCNSKTFNQLEDAVQEVLPALAEGRLRLESIDGQKRVQLARWAWKTTLVLHRASNFRRVAPDQHYRHLGRGEPELPEGVCVVARLIRDARGCSWSQNPFAALRPANGIPPLEVLQQFDRESYRIGLRLDQIALFVAYCPFAGATFELDRSQHDLLYPADGRGISWKPEKPEQRDAEPDDIDAVFRAFCTSLTMRLPPFEGAAINQPWVANSPWPI